MQARLVENGHYSYDVYQDEKLIGRVGWQLSLRKDKHWYSETIPAEQKLGPFESPELAAEALEQEEDLH
jgi:hypothetical protein